MRIALVSHEYPPFWGGGIGTYAALMSQLLARAGHEVHVLTNRFGLGSRDSRHAQAVHQEGNLWVHRINALTDSWEPAPPHDRHDDLLGGLHREWSPYLYYSECVAHELAAICERHDIEIIEFPECAAEGYMTVRRKRLGLGFLDRPITITLHSPIYEIHHYNLYSKFDFGFQRRAMMEDYSIRYADAVNSPSRLLADIVYCRLELKPGEPLCDVLALPMDPDCMPRLREPDAPRVDAASPTLLFAGRLEPRKGVRDLVDAAVRIMKDNRDLRVLLIGRDCDAGEAPGKMSDFLKSRIPPALRSRFVFSGPMPRQELFEQFARATACVFAAPWDNFPLTCVEAMSSGACVIASDFTGMAEMIEHEKSGLLFKAQDVDSLTASIDRVLSDQELVARIRRAAPLRIREVCDPGKAVSNRIAHYERAIEAHRRRVAGRMPVPVPTSERLAVLIAGADQLDAIRRTIRSVRVAAQRANLDLDIAISGEKPEAAENGLEGGSFVGVPTGAPSLRAWVEHLKTLSPDYLFTLAPGEAVAEHYFCTVRDALTIHSSGAWATTWLTPSTGSGTSYAGFDFSVPLEILGCHPVPFAIIRYSAFKAVGGWNLDLPSGWRDWDLRLAFEEHKLEGLVCPSWLGQFVPRKEYTLQALPDESLAQVYEKIVSRSPELFARYGLCLWLFRALNSTPNLLPPPPAKGHQAGNWLAWSRLTRACLKEQFPRLAAWYRRSRSKRLDS